MILKGKLLLDSRTKMMALLLVSVCVSEHSQSMCLVLHCSQRVFQSQTHYSSYARSQIISDVLFDLFYFILATYTSQVTLL